MEKDLDELIAEWKNFFDWITDPSCGWSGYDLSMEDFHELKMILDFANKNRGETNG